MRVRPPPGAVWLLAGLIAIAGCAGSSTQGAPSGAGNRSGPVRVPATLVDMEADAVTALLGTPELRRREGTGELWQYRTAACVVDLFLYDGADGLTVAHAESRSRHTLGADAPDCLTSVVAGAAGRGSTPTS